LIGLLYAASGSLWIGGSSGSSAQARWMTTAIPAILHAGAAIVFVTERDSLTGPYASEGVLQTTDPLTAFSVYTRRPSFYAVRTFATATGARPTHLSEKLSLSIWPPHPRSRSTSRSYRHHNGSRSWELSSRTRSE
jgi:hypothetical protein